ncbi:DUF2842 domain-containing protein [Leptolyngbya sp. 15MV]|nr:DUF2842 domain-containing protein [Leptolyngbya sp. 15MV]
MRKEPSWRVPVGIIGLLVGLTVYGLLIARYMPELIGGWPTIAQTLVYLVLGVIWLLPLKPFLIWMEAGGRG